MVEMEVPYPAPIRHDPDLPDTTRRDATRRGPARSQIRTNPTQRDVLAGLNTVACPNDVAGSSPTSVLADTAIQFPMETTVASGTPAVRPAMEQAAKSKVKTGQKEEQDEEGEVDEEEGYEILSMDDF